MGVEWILNLTLNEADMITFSCPLWVSSYFRMRTFYSPSRQHFCHLVKRLKVVGIMSKMRHLSQGTVGEEVKQEAFLMTSSEHLDPATPEGNTWPFQIHESPHPLSKKKKTKNKTLHLEHFIKSNNKSYAEFSEFYIQIPTMSPRLTSHKYIF